MYRRTSYARQPYSSSLSGGYSSYLTAPRSSSTSYGTSALTNGYSSARSAGYESDYGGSSLYRSPRRYGGARTDSNLDADADSSSHNDATTSSAARSYRGARSQQDLSTLDGGNDYGNGSGSWRTSSSYGNYGNGRSSATVASTSYHPSASTSTSYGGRYNFSRDSKSVTRDAGSDRYTSPYSSSGQQALSRSGSRSRLSEVDNRAPSVPPRRHSSKTSRTSGETSRDTNGRGSVKTSSSSRYGDRGLIRSSSSRDLREIADTSTTTSDRASSRTAPPRKIRHQTLTFGVSPSDLDRARTLNHSSSFRRSGSIGDVNRTSTSDLTSRVGGFASDMSVGPLVTVSSSGMVCLGARARERERERARRASATSSSDAAKKSSFAESDYDDVGYSSQPASRRDSVSSLSSTAHKTSSSTSPAAAAAIAAAAAAATSRSQNGGEVDYKKLWEESQKENNRLRDEMTRLRDDLGATKRKLDNAVTQAAANTSTHTTSYGSSGLSDAEKREKRVLEKKLSEMEEELKQLEHLKNDNQRLRDENGALIRVISKLSK